LEKYFEALFIYFSANPVQQATIPGFIPPNQQVGIFPFNNPQLQQEIQHQQQQLQQLQHHQMQQQQQLHQQEAAANGDSHRVCKKIVITKESKIGLKSC
jgi:hypothetical protein